VNDARNVAEQREADINEQITAATALACHTDGLQKVPFASFLKKKQLFTHR
jgi:hypothetical protein